MTPEKTGNPLSQSGITEKVVSQFWKKVDRSSTCWNWKGNKDRQGYGRMRLKYRLVRTHRLSWVIRHGDIEPGLYVLHNCDNPACVNPEHLRLGTAADNNRDKKERGRCFNGNRDELSGEKCNLSKLSESEVAEIRRLRREEGLSTRQIAERFRITTQNVSLILRGKTWTRSLVN